MKTESKFRHFVVVTLPKYYSFIPVLVWGGLEL